MNLGRAIKTLRKHKNMSQNELAAEIGMTQSSLSQIESNVKRPSTKNMARLCKALNTPEPIIYLMATDENDVPESRRETFNKLFPDMKQVIFKIIGE